MTVPEHILEAFRELSYEVGEVTQDPQADWVYTVDLTSVGETDEVYRVVLCRHHQPYTSWVLTQFSTNIPRLVALLIAKAVTTADFEHRFPGRPR